MINNHTSCVIVKVIADYDYTYMASGNGYYLRSCNRLQSIKSTDYDYPMAVNQPLSGEPRKRFDGIEPAILGGWIMSIQ